MRSIHLVLLATLTSACNSAPLPPEIGIVPAEPWTTDDLVGTVVTEAVDPNDDPVTYAWSWTVDGQETDLHDPVVPAARTTKGQVWTATLLAVDDREHEAEAATLSITVRNSRPTVSATPVVDAPATTDDLTITYATDDADDDTVSVQFSWTRDGDATPHTGPTVPSSETARGQIWVASVLPDDGEERGEPAIVEFSIDNLAPVVHSVTLAPQRPTETSVVQATVEANDEDGDTITLDYTWQVNGVDVPGDHGDRLHGTDFDKGETINVVVVASDDVLDSEPVTSDDLLVQNTPPTLDGVSVQPADVYEATPITCVPTGWSDIDDDAESYRYSWIVDGVLVGTAATLDGASFDRDQTVICEATPFDGEHDGKTVGSEAVTVRNTAPTLASAAIANATPRTNDTLTLTMGTIADGDGDEVVLEYVWYVDGKATGSTSTLDGSHFNKDQEVFTRITPFDGTDRGTIVQTSTRTILNTAPVMTSASISPTVLYTDTIAAASWTATDEDSDELTATIEWLVNGKVVATGTSLDGAAGFDKDDKVQLRITPSDGDDAGVPLTTAAVVVQNSAPTAPVLAIDPKIPDEKIDDILCKDTKPAEDKDGDKLTYEFSWRLDRKVYTGAITTVHKDDTIDSAVTRRYQRYTCIARVTDGVAFSPIASTSVSVRPVAAEIASISAATLHGSSVREGAWMTDPKRKYGGRVWVLPGYRSAYLQEYSTFADFVWSRSPKTLRLSYGNYAGTGHTLHNGILYYHVFGTNRIAAYDVARSRTVRVGLLTGTVYNNAGSYLWGGFTDIDLAYDETGLYAIYTGSRGGNIKISKIDPNTMKATKTWYTTRKKAAGNSFMVDGVLYVTASHSSLYTTIDYAFNTHNGKASNPGIVITNPFRYTTQLDYNYGDKKLYAWDNGRLITYNLTFK